MSIGKTTAAVPTYNTAEITKGCSYHSQGISWFGSSKCYWLKRSLLLSGCLEKPMKTNTRGVRSDVDRGWAWIVMIVVYVGMIILSLPLFMNGVLYVALLEKFHENEAKTSLVGAISSGLLCFFAPVGGILNNRYSCRVSIMVGGVLTTLGFAMSAFVPSLNWMIVTNGIIVGTGYGISSAGIVCVVGFYFEKLRDQIISISYLFVGVSMFISSPLGLYLISEYTLSSTFLLLAGIQAQLCVLGMFCKPSSIENDIHEQKIILRKEKTYARNKSYIDLSLLRQKAYLFFLFSTIAWNLGLYTAVMHLPNYISTSGGDNSDIGWLMTSFSIANLIGRFLGSIAVSKFNQHALRFHVIALGLNGVITSLFLLYSKIPGGTYIFATQLGLFVGVPSSMMTSLSLSFVGVANLSEAYGFSYVFCGFGVTIGPIVVGYLYGTTGTYEYSFLFAGFVLLLGCLCGYLALYWRNKLASEPKTLTESENNSNHDCNRKIKNVSVCKELHALMEDVIS